LQSLGLISVWLAQKPVNGSIQVRSRHTEFDFQFLGHLPSCRGIFVITIQKKTAGPTAAGFATTYPISGLADQK
jgi:hypothetical protein